jgi:hypothetical protein
MLAMRSIFVIDRTQTPIYNEYSLQIGDYARSHCSGRFSLSRSWENVSCMVICGQLGIIILGVSDEQMNAKQGKKGRKLLLKEFKLHFHCFANHAIIGVC